MSVAVSKIFNKTNILFYSIMLVPWTFWLVWLLGSLHTTTSPFVIPNIYNKYYPLCTNKRSSTTFNVVWNNWTEWEQSSRLCSRE